MVYPNPLITACVLFVAALLGLVVGSFVNCWAWRYVRGESVAHGRSHCASCAHDLGVCDLVPLVSWIVLRGRCRYCGAKVSVRYPLTEALCAVVFVLIVFSYGLTVEMVELLLFASVLLMLSLVDLDKRIIPNGCILVVLVVRAAYLAYACTIGLMSLSAVGFYLASGIGMGLVLVGITLAADRVFGRESMGGGDLKLFAVAGFYFGWQQGLFLVIAACLIGIVTAAGAAALSGGLGGRTPRGTKGDLVAETSENGNFMRRTIPLGPSIAAACVLTMLVGNPLISWYLGLL